MDIQRSFSINQHFLFLLVLITYSDGGHLSGAHLMVDINKNNLPLETISVNSTKNEGNFLNISNCTGKTIHSEDASFLNGSDILLKTMNITLQSSDYMKEDGKVFAGLDCRSESKNKIITECKEVVAFDSEEFQIFPNRSVLLYGETLLPEEYEMREGKLLVCNDYDSYETSLVEVSVYVTKIGSGISIAALAIHLLILYFIPSFQNLSGYNLASLSVAFFLAYSFIIIAQIPQVVDLYCVISGVLLHFFLLAAFFCMNVIAFDVWRTLNLTTGKSTLKPRNVPKRQFSWYSLYAWGLPLVISSTSVIVDNIDGVPLEIKPYYGRNDDCRMTNEFARTIFFSIPAFTLFMINALFFFRSAMLIYKYSKKNQNEKQKQGVKFNFVLYVKLGILMGLTWLIAVIAKISGNHIVWLIHDILNSLQGLFLFLFFTCTKKVFKHLKENVIYFCHNTKSSEHVLEGVTLELKP